MYEFTCTYLCGNKVINKDTVDPKRSEKCDIGEWAFSKLDNKGYYTYADPTAAATVADVDKWIKDESNDKTVGSPLGLGCTKDCIPYEDGERHFKYDPDNYSSKGTDRCGDGFMDGPIPLTFDGAGAPVTYIRSSDFTTYIEKEETDADGVKTIVVVTPGTKTLSGYTTYWPTENYAGRILSEECDNGGDTEHGCDYLCRVMPGWECFHYYHHLLGLELPIFTSICQEKDLKTLSRRLSPEDFDEKGRILHDMPRRTQYYTLPDNAHEMRPGKHTPYLSAKKGLNGQIRLFEDSTCTDCYGFIMGYQRDSPTDPDYFYLNSN